MQLAPKAVSALLLSVLATPVRADDPAPGFQLEPLAVGRRVGEALLDVVRGAMDRIGDDAERRARIDLGPSDVVTAPQLIERGHQSAHVAGAVAAGKSAYQKRHRRGQRKDDRRHRRERDDGPLRPT